MMDGALTGAGFVWLFLSTGSFVVPSVVKNIKHIKLIKTATPVTTFSSTSTRAVAMMTNEQQQDQELDLSRTSTFFNGGKMQHIFAFNDETRRYETDGSFSSPEAEEALLHGTLFYKIDGANGMVQILPFKENNINDDNDDNNNDNDNDNDKEATKPTIHIYERLDTKGKDPPPLQDGPNYIPLPPGNNPAAYTGHSYVYAPITTLDHVKGKKLLQRNRAMMDLVQRHADKFMAKGREFVSVEWVGQKFQQTPNVPHPVAVAIHDEQLVVNEDDVDSIKRTYHGMRKYLLEDCADQPVEGFVIEHKGVFWKVRADCFLLPKGEATPFRVNKDQARPPVFLA